MSIATLPETGAAAVIHGDVEVRHYVQNDTVSVRVGRQSLAVSDRQGRELAECLAELFPSMALEAQHHDLDGGAR